MSDPKPHPRASRIHQQILASLLENPTAKRQVMRGRWIGPENRREWVERPVGITVPLLAGHVSGFNVELASQRWLK